MGRGLPPREGLVCLMAEIEGKLMDLGIWNKNWSRNKIWKKNSLSGHNFFLNLDRKITGLGIWNRFGMDLVIPNIWLFWHLGEKQIMAGTHYTNQTVVRPLVEIFFF